MSREHRTYELLVQLEEVGQPKKGLQKCVNPHINTNMIDRECLDGLGRHGEGITRMVRRELKY